MRHVHASNSMMLSSISAAFASRLDINQHRCRLELIHPTTPTPPTKTISTVGGGDSTGELFSIPIIDTIFHYRYLFFFTCPITISNSTLCFIKPPAENSTWPSPACSVASQCLWCTCVSCKRIWTVATVADKNICNHHRLNVLVTNGVSASLCGERIGKGFFVDKYATLGDMRLHNTPYYMFI